MKNDPSAVEAMLVLGLTELADGEHEDIEAHKRLPKIGETQ